MRKRSSKGGGAQRSIQVHLMVNEEEAAMIRAAARKRNQTVSLTIIEAVWLVVFLPFRCCSRRVAPFYKNLLISFRLPRKQLAVGESRH